MKTPMESMFDAVEFEVLPPHEDDGSGLPYATHRGILTLFGKYLECFVLSNGQRVFTEDSLERFFGGT